MNTSAFGVERGTLFRVPATANLMIDSADRNPILDASGIDISSPWDYTLTRKQSLIQGFFSRVGTTEVVLEWAIPNISAQLNNRTFQIREASGNIITVNLPQANYTVAEALDALVGELESQVAWGWNINQVLGEYTLDNTDLEVFRILPGRLALQLGLNPLGVESFPSPAFPIVAPDLRPYRYIDFVCNQLTAVQDVKDASSQPRSVDVLCRWYFADDNPNQFDTYDFPILQGYTKFVQRRIFNPPKQIKWEQNFPVGGFLEFLVLTPSGDVVPQEENNQDWAGVNLPSRSNWLMTLQLSEG